MANRGGEISDSRRKRDKAEENIDSNSDLGTNADTQLCKTLSFLV